MSESAQVATASAQLSNASDVIASGTEAVVEQASSVATASEEMAATSADIAHSCLTAVSQADCMFMANWRKASYAAQTCRIPLPSCMDRSDLHSLAAIGLINAIRRFDHAIAGEIPFSSFAEKHIKGALIDGIRSARDISRCQADRIKHLSGCRTDFISANQYHPTDKELASWAGLDNPETVVTLEQMSQITHVDIDGAIADRNGSQRKITDTLPSNDPSPEQTAIQKQLREILSRAINALPKKERTAVVRRIIEEVPAIDVAVELGVTPSRISQLVKSGLEKLRKKYRQITTRHRASLVTPSE